MAAVHAPPLPSHPPFRRTSRVPDRIIPPPPPRIPYPRRGPASVKVDSFYGHEEISRLSARYITHLFSCPEKPPPSSGSQVKLPHFIAYALHRTKLDSSVMFAALALLQRLKSRFPSARGSSGHRLFISAYMIASKVICDDTYSNKSWCIVGQNMYTLREINQMEREMCGYLDWDIGVESSTISGFETMLKRDFSGPGPYPPYPFKKSENVYTGNTSPKPVPVPSPPSSNPPPDTSPSEPHTVPRTTAIDPLTALQNTLHYSLRDSVLNTVGRDQSNHTIVIHNLTLCSSTSDPPIPERLEIIKGESILGLWTIIYPRSKGIHREQYHSARVLPEIRSTGRQNL